MIVEKRTIEVEIESAGKRAVLEPRSLDLEACQLPPMSPGVGAVALKERLRLGDNGGEGWSALQSQHGGHGRTKKGITARATYEEMKADSWREFESGHPQTGQKEVFPNKRPLRAAISGLKGPLSQIGIQIRQ